MVPVWVAYQLPANMYIHKGANDLIYMDVESWSTLRQPHFAEKSYRNGSTHDWNIKIAFVILLLFLVIIFSPVLLMLPLAHAHPRQIWLKHLPTMKQACCANGVTTNNVREQTSLNS